VLVPTQIFAVAGEIFAVAGGNTVTFLPAVAVHNPAVTVTVYVVFVTGLTVTDCEVAPLLHSYIALLGNTDKVMLSPEHTSAGSGDMIGAGIGSTSIVFDTVAVQPLLVTVTV
jgi:hypothetical protein